MLSDIKVKVSFLFQALNNQKIQPDSTSSNNVAIQLQHVVSIEWLYGQDDCLMWLDANRFVDAAELGLIQCYDLSRKAILWSKQMGGKIEGISTCGRRVFVHVVTVESEIIYALDAIDGSIKAQITGDALAENLGLEYLRIGSIDWVPQRQWLVVSISAYPQDIHVIIDGQTSKILKNPLAAKLTRQVQASDSGSHLVGLEGNQIRIWDTATGQEIYKIGSSKRSAVDLPFVSNVAFGSKNTLVYCVDNSWATGRVVVVDVARKKELARFDSLNGHAKMAVDFKHQRIALAGTSPGLTIMDFTAKKLAQIKDAFKRRILSITLSPDGRHLALGGWDKAVHVFEIAEASLQPKP
jgi:WD40 repeat protein